MLLSLSLILSYISLTAGICACEFNLSNLSVDTSIPNGALNVSRYLRGLVTHTQIKSNCTSCAADARGGRMDGWSQDVACVHDVISPCTVRHFGRKKKITDNFRGLDRSGSESHTDCGCYPFLRASRIVWSGFGSRVQPQLLHEAMAGKPLLKGGKGPTSLGCVVMAWMCKLAGHR